MRIWRNSDWKTETETGGGLTASRRNFARKLQSWFKKCCSRTLNNPSQSVKKLLGELEDLIQDHTPDNIYYDGREE